MRRRDRWVGVLASMLLWACVAPLPLADANGGTLRVSRAPAGPFSLTVFTAPTPPRVGLGDISVSIENAATGDLEPNARVIVFATPLDAFGGSTAYEASHERATDPGFYAADVPFERPGRWRIEVLAMTATAEGALAFEIDVEPAVTPTPTPAPPSSNPLGQIGPLAAGLAALISGVSAFVLARRWRRRATP